MTPEAFHQALIAALHRHFPQATATVDTTRGITLTCKAAINEDTFVFVYFSALTDKTSYALIHLNRRIAGFDNYRFWHYHPADASSRHIPCAEPTPEEALDTLAKVLAGMISG